VAQERLSTEVRRRQIVETALNLLADTPLEGLTTRQLAAAMDLTQPALFRHFASRDELLVGVARHARGELGALVEGLLREPMSPVERLRRLAVGLLTYVEEHPGLPRILFADVVVGSGELHGVLSHLVSMQRTFVRQLVGAGQRGGLLSGRVDLDEVATLFVSVLQGEIFMWQFEGRTSSLAARADAIFELWLCGVAARSGEGPQPSLPEPVAATLGGIESLDVRPIIAGGVDPLEVILARLAPMRAGSILLVTAPFSPRPLVRLLESSGHGVQCEELARETHLVTVRVHRRDPVCDLRDLEPPEPLEAVLEASMKLAAGQTYVARLPRFPRLLVGHLESRPVVFAIEELEDGSALIWLEGMAP
jgi:AcrR family transcriptional regulator/uncharacterized protein (DUF2249 family)